MSSSTVNIDRRPLSQSSRNGDEHEKSNDENKEEEVLKIPVIDMTLPEEVLVKEIAIACSTWGFFQVVCHGVPPDIRCDFRREMRRFFALPYESKMRLKRNQSNARGYFDDELTKQKRDWKEAFDAGMPGSRDWNLPDDHPRNKCLDGHNRFPDEDEAPGFRSAVVRYFDACAHLADRIATLMALGLGVATTDESLDLRSNHTSYLRMNYYPTCDFADTRNNQTLGISPHTDAGFLTVLLQDDDCHSLQVAKQRNNDWTKHVDWVTVRPIPGALTVNTGDMAMIWSNGKYRAPLHRVLSDETRVRYSAPFFYNPSYRAEISPIVRNNDIDDDDDEERSKYHPCVWGYFRAVRFAGDLTDLGAEIQISDYHTTNNSTLNHLENQAAFLKMADFTVPFSVETYRPLLQNLQ